MTQPHPSTNPLTHSRAALRKSLLEQRGQIELAQRQLWDAQIKQQLLDWCQQHRPASLAVFWPFRSEPDLLDSYPLLQQMGIQLALPVVVAKNQALQFLQWAPGDAMHTDEYGIFVPARRDRVLRPEALVIPCVGFNRQNFRLGYGGGFYDRTLAPMPRPQTIGVAYKLGKIEFAEGRHDVAMDRILTES
jgi:5-formyltetrahydrofolate cyclo-ligase